MGDTNVSTEQSEQTTGGIVGKVAGKAKEAIGSATGDNDMAREGRLQQAQSDAEIEARREAAEAERAEAEAKLEQDRNETEIERDRLKAELTAEEREARAEADRVEAEQRAAADAARERAQAA